MSGAAAAAENHVISIVNPARFSPLEITIEVGDTVTFQKGTSQAGHNVVADGFEAGCSFGPTCFRCGLDGCRPLDGSGGTLGDPTSAAFSITLDVFHQTGTFPFYCEPHGSPGGNGMAGSIVVQQSAPPPPTGAPGQIRFTSANYNRDESVGSATIQVERTGGAAAAVGVSYATSNGTATAGQDYTATAGMLAWAAGEDGTKGFSVPIDDDTADEPNETVLLTLSSPTGGATLGTPSNATLTIADNDSPAAAGQLRFTNGSFSAGEAVAHAIVTVARSGGAQGAVSVEYDTADGSAKAGQDYTAVSGTLDWAAGDSANKMTEIPLLDDTDFEGDETFSVVLSQPTGGATLGAPATAMVTINDNEAVPPCTDGEHSACLLDRFLVGLRFATQGGQTGDARATKLTDSSSAFEFFDAGNIEIVVKMRDACGFPVGNPLRNYWVFVAGLTNVRVEMVLVDTETGTTRRFHNALNQPFFTAAADSPDGKQNPPGAIQATSEALGAFATCDP